MFIYSKNLNRQMKFELGLKPGALIYCIRRESLKFTYAQKQIFEITIW